jgi:hypothetical protein
MIAKSPADEIAGQAARICPRDEPSLPAQWRFLEMYKGDVDELELDAADSVERGAAALFLAGFGPKPAASLPRSRTAKGSGRNTGRSASARRSRKPTRPAR